MAGEHVGPHFVGEFSDKPRSRSCPACARPAVRYDELELHVEEERIRAKWDALAVKDAETRQEARSGINVIGCLVIVLVAMAAGGCIALWLWFTAPRSSSDVSPRPATTVAPSHMSGSDGRGASAPSAERFPPAKPLAAGGAPDSAPDAPDGGRSYRAPLAATSGATGLGTALVGGVATWYDAPSPKDAAAGPDLRFDGWRGSWVRVTSGERSVTVRLTDWCACGDRNGQPTVIDLDDEAFADLAPLSRGVIGVEVEVLGDAPALPETSTED